MKKLYLDSANLDEIALCLRTDAIDGVTTNPSLMAKEKKGGYTERLVDICELFQEISTAKKHLSVEVITLDPGDMFEQAVTLKTALGKYDKVDLYVKIPLMFETLPVISRLNDERIKVNATACMTALQAKLAHDAGAPIVSFFYNRMLDGAVEAETEINRFSTELNRNSQIICGSIRKADDVRKCWKSGADIVTASLKVIKEMVTHPKTDEAIKQFQRDIETWLK